MALLMMNPSPQPSSPNRALPSDPRRTACSLYPPKACNQLPRTEPRPAAGAGGGLLLSGAPANALPCCPPPAAYLKSPTVPFRGLYPPIPNHISPPIVPSSRFSITQVQQQTIPSNELLYSFNKHPRVPSVSTLPTPPGASRSEETAGHSTPQPYGQ